MVAAYGRRFRDHLVLMVLGFIQGRHERLHMRA